MKSEHCEICLEKFPECLCNTCKHDPGTVFNSCCDRKNHYCPVTMCPDYEPDDEEDDDESTPDSAYPGP